MSAICELEPLPDGSLLARIGGADWKYGDDYDLSVTVCPKDEDTAEIKGLDKTPTAAHWRALSRALKERGYRFFEFERIVNGEVEKHRATC